VEEEEEAEEEEEGASEDWEIMLKERFFEFFFSSEFMVHCEGRRSSSANRWNLDLITFEQTSTC
jgi:hypothetical protein